MNKDLEKIEFWLFFTVALLLVFFGYVMQARAENLDDSVLVGTINLGGNTLIFPNYYNTSSTPYGNYILLGTPPNTIATQDISLSISLDTHSPSLCYFNWHLWDITTQTDLSGNMVDYNPFGGSPFKGHYNFHLSSPVSLTQGDGYYLVFNPIVQYCGSVNIYGSNDGIAYSSYQGLSQPATLQFRAPYSGFSNNDFSNWTFYTSNNAFQQDLDNTIVVRYATSSQVLTDPAFGYSDTYTSFSTALTRFVSFPKTTLLSSTTWYATARLYSSQYQLIATSSITFDIVGGLENVFTPSQLFTLEACPDFTFGSSTLSTIGCNVSNFFKGIGNWIGETGNSLITTLGNLIVRVFPVNIFYHVYNDFQIAAAAPPPALPDLVVPLSSGNVSLITSSTEARIKATYGGYDYKDLWNKIIWAILGLIIIAEAWLIIAHLKSNKKKDQT